MSTTVAALELRGVSTAYGPFRALFDVRLSVAPGRVVAIVGPNGAGKTTLARVATGLLSPTGGEVRVAGEDVTGRRAHEFVARGVTHVPEGRPVFAGLTVEENLQLGLARGRGQSSLVDRVWDIFPVLAERRRQLADHLSGGEQRMLALARVLVAPPSVLIVDELSFGLAPLIVEAVYERLAEVRETGASLVVIEQHVEHALALADEVVVIGHGTVRWQGSRPDFDGLSDEFLVQGR